MQTVPSIGFRLYAWGAADTSGIFGLGPNPGGYSFSLGGLHEPGFPEAGFPVPGYPPTTIHLYATQGSPSFSQAISVSGEVMDSMTVSATPGYELSLDNMNFYPAFTLYPHPNSVDASATVYVRLDASWPPGDANGAFGLSSWRRPSVQLNYTGTVYPAPAISLSVDNNALEFGNAATGATVDKKLQLTTTTLSSNITATATTHYLVSTDSIHFASTVTIARDTAGNKTLPLFVRFSPNGSGLEFNDSITISADTSIVVQVKGNTIPPATTLGITSWNLNSFATPQPGAGPADKTQQINNVRTILSGVNADVYALQAVVNDSALAAVVATLPGYAYTISSYGSNSNPFDHYYPADSPDVARLAFVYKTSRLRNIQTTALFGADLNTQADLNNPYYSWWAAGRYPYMLTADVDLSDSLGNTITKTIRFINIHAAVNTGQSIADYTGRYNAAYMLDTLIKQHYSGDNVVILGDFNDDLNRTTIPGVDSISPYSPLVTDTTLFSFPTKILSQQHQRSNAGAPGVKQNLIVNNTMSSWYLPSSALILSQVASQVPAYTATTAGNYPLLTRFSFTPPVALPITLLDFTGIRQGSKAKLSWKTTNESNAASFIIERNGDGGSFTAIGTVARQNSKKQSLSYRFTDASPLSGNNYYRLKMVDQDGAFSFSRTVMLSFSPITLQISPNPAHGTANLYIGNNTEAYFIQLFDGNGRSMRQYRTTPGNTVFPIDLSGLSKGVYTVKVTGATASVTQILLVQ